MLTMDDRVRPNPEVVVTELDGNEAVLLHLDTKLYFSLNSTGLWLWKRFTEERNLKEVSEQLQREFDVTQEKAEQSVLELAQQLHAEELLDVIPGDTA